jgi:very-short-patch-repair endonuclease
LRGLDGINEGAIEISVPVGHQPHLRGVIVHRTRRLEAIDITTYRGIPTTTVTRTLIDLGAVVPRLVVERALEDALRRGLTTEGAIVRRLAEIGGRGCRGVGVMRLVLSRRLEGRPRSGAEVMLLDLLREAGIEGLARAHPIRLNGRVIAEVDLAIPHLRIAIEFDSKKYRMRVREFERGSERAQLLASLGWVVIPVTWEQLTKRPDQVVAAVLRTISNIVLSPA